MITYCIPYYSNLEFLKLTIRSLLEQTDPHWQAIVVDDCGPEPEAANWVQHLNDPRISYRRNERNLGLAGNWNRCFALATTPFVTLLHADDELTPSYNSRMKEVLSKYPNAAAVCCDATIIGPSGDKVFSFPDLVKSYIKPVRESGMTETWLVGESAMTSILKGNFIMCPTLCYRRAEFDSSPFNGEYQMVLDLDLTTRILLQNKSIVLIHEELYRYRRHSSNQTVVLTEKLTRFEEEVALYRALFRPLEEKGWFGAAKVSYRGTIIKLNLAFCVCLDLLRVRIRPAWAKARYLFGLVAQGL